MSLLKLFKFDGATYEPEHDEQRLTSQLAKVKQLMSDGEWRTLSEIASAVNGSEAGVSARLRDLKSPRKFGLNIEKQRVSGGLWKYRMVV